MKKVWIILGIMLLLSSCTLEEILNELAPDMTAKIDGNEWKASIPYAAIEEDKFIITGLSLEGKSIIVTLNGTDAGNYELNLTSAECTAVYKESTSDTMDDAYLAVSCSVYLSEVNPEKMTISGTFSFSAMREINEPAIEITEGRFTHLGYSENTEQ